MTATTDDPFATSLAFTLDVEGGVSSDPKDRAATGHGPHTNLGITLKAVRALDADGKLSAFLRDKFDVNDDGVIDERDVPGWGFDVAEAFYREHYWKASGCDRVPFPYSMLLFDGAVNMGCVPSIKALQRGLGVDDDGVMGPKTVWAACMAQKSARAMASVVASRLDMNRHFPTADEHFKGWAVRCLRLYAATN